ncbi:hypothetical protein ACFVQB_29040 [Paenibacillus sp. NPDC057886]|uniref:hypothetical protein n=1 Tax=Paenibacillus sp. NPDC057886 TaxID=3346270 RepID=UPI00367C6B70
MMDLKTYGYTEIDAIPDGLLPGRVTELRRQRFTVMTGCGEVTAVLKGTFYHSAETRVVCVSLVFWMLTKAYAQALPMWRDGSRNADLRIAAISPSRAVPFLLRLPIAIQSKQTKKKGGGKK